MLKSNLVNGSGFDHVSRIRDTKEEKLKCSFCGNEFTNVKGRSAHERSGVCHGLKNIDLNESLQGGANCPDCGKNYANKLALKSHQKFCKEKPGAIDYQTFARMNPDRKCKVCGRNFAQMSGLYGHSKYCRSKDTIVDDTTSEYLDKYDAYLDNYYSHEDMDHTEITEPSVNIKTEATESDIVQVIKPNLSPIIEMLPSLQCDDPYHDVTIVSSDRSLLTCHAAVLAAGSPYFAQLLAAPCRDDETVLIIAENVTVHNLKNLLNLLYAGNVRTSEAGINDLKMLLEEFKIHFNPEIFITNYVDRESEEGLASDIVDSCNRVKPEMDELSGFVGHLDHFNLNLDDMYTDNETLDESNVSTDKICTENDDDEDYILEKKKPKNKKMLTRKKGGRPKQVEMLKSNNLSACDYCDLKSKTLNETMKHVKKEHADMFEEFAKSHVQTQCQYCEEKFLNEKCLYYHKKAKHPETLQDVVINHKDTGKTGRRRRYTIEDGLPHKADRQCPHCPRILRDIESFEDHVQAHLAGTDHPYSCDSCGRKFQRSFRLRLHKKKHKISETPLLCNLCGSIFQTEFEYKKHSSTHIQRQFKTLKKKIVNANFSCLCNICGQNFTSKTKYKYHINTAHVEADELITCPHCPQTFTKIIELDRHVPLHLPPTVQCSHCEKKFRTKTYLKNHIKTTHTADNLKDFVCAECGKGFNSKENYEGHLNMHAGVKPFRCRYCEMCYQNKSNRMAHEKSRHPDLYVKIRIDNLGGVPVNKRQVL